MTQNEFNQVVTALKDCNDYLEGRMHSAVLQSIAKQGADAAIIEYRKTLLLDLANAGLILED